VQNIAVSVADAAKITGIGRSSLYRLIAAGKLSPRKLGRRTLLLQKDLEGLVESLPRARSSGTPIIRTAK
jgi:excisionase family DNA binding protein